MPDWDHKVRLLVIARSRFCSFNKYYYSINYLFSRFSISSRISIHFSIAILHGFNIVLIYIHRNILPPCYFAIVFTKYLMARGTLEKQKTVLSRMNVRIIGEEPGIILLGHRDKLDKREFWNYHSKPGHDSSLLQRS